MNKAELEERIKFLERKNDGLSSLVYEIKKVIQANLEPFRNNVADWEDERNKGILAVLNVLVGVYNRHSNFNKIEPLQAYKCEVMKFKIEQGETNGSK